MPLVRALLLSQLAASPISVLSSDLQQKCQAILNRGMHRERGIQCRRAMPVALMGMPHPTEQLALELPLFHL